MNVSESMNKMNKKENLKVILTVVFVTAMLISNTISPIQVQLSHTTLTAGLIVFPITYILSDVFSECYGYKWSRITCYLAFTMCLITTIIYQISINLPVPDYWENQEAYRTVLGSTPRILISSLIAYVAGDFVNDKIFQRMKERYLDSSRGFSKRAILSSAAGNFVDCAIYLPLAFWGQMPVDTLMTMCLLQVIVKTSYEIVILPMTNLVVGIIGGLSNDKA